MKITPPKYPLRFLYWFCKSELVEEIEGDLNEEFDARVQKFGGRKARWIYALQILSFFRPYAIKSFNLPILNFIPMYTHYGKIAFRNFARQKLYTTINILSLAIGIACAALIFLFIQDELTFDQHHELSDQIYRVNRAWYDDTGQMVEVSAVQAMPFAEVIQADLPEVQYSCRFYLDNGYVKLGESSFEEDFLMADPVVLKMFTYHPIYGKLDGSLETPNEVVISEKISKKYFGEENPVGKILEINYSKTKHQLVVKAVVENPPSNSTIKFDLLLSFELLEKVPQIQEYTSWGINFLPTYVLLHENADLVVLKEKLPALRKKHLGDRIYAGRDSMYTASYHFQPLADIHFNTSIPGTLAPTVDSQYIRILGGIGLVILLLACINFMILSVGRSARRAREIGLRKVIGAKKTQLMGQFLSEAVLLSTLGLILGLGMVYVVLPTFNDLSEKALTFGELFAPDTLFILIGITLLSGLLAGSYPAFLLSNFDTVNSLRNQYKLGGTNFFTRILVSTQFSMSIVLIIGTLVMMFQLSYLNSKNLGFDKEELLVVHRQGAVETSTFYQTFKDRLAQNPRILNISGTSPAFTKGIFSSNFSYNGKEIPYNILFVDADYIQTLGMKMAVGRDFDPALSSDSTEHIIINEAFARAIEDENPVGKPIKGLENADYEDPIVIGVVEDFHFNSLKEEVTPVWLAMNNYDFNHLLIRVQSGEMSSTLEQLAEIWGGIAPEVPFKYSFMDEDLAAQYKSEERWKKVVNAAAILAIFISCMGLFGLVALSVKGRTKEIGIRKVLGASLGQIGITLSKEFSLLMLIAFICSIPIGWYLASQWLQNFAYRISISPFLFIVAGLVVVLVFVITMSYHIIRAGKTNPIEALRHE